MNYGPLAVEITQNGGHHYRQIWRDEQAAVYEQRNAFGTLVGYEAITIKRQEPCRVFGKMYPAKEIYPCSEDWGKLAVSASDLERAMTVAQELSKIAKQDLKGRQKGPSRSRIGQGRPAKGQVAMGVPANHKVSQPKPVLEVSSEVRPAAGQVPGDSR
jgi:hypothetical protein